MDYLDENQVKNLIANEIAYHEKCKHKKRAKRKKKEKPYTEQFELFWKKFKGRWNEDWSSYDKGGKREAFEEWEKLKIEEQRQAWSVAHKTGSKITPDACRWLKKKRFED